MKTRQGFVSNSSSSSFVVAIPKLPNAPKEIKDNLFFEDGVGSVDIKQLMFGGEEILYGPYDDNQQNPFDAEQIATIVKTDMDNQTPNSISVIAEELSDYDGYGEDNVEGLTDSAPVVPEYDYGRDRTPEEDRKYWDNREKLSKKRGKFLAERFIKASKGCDVYVFSYADEDGAVGSMMEHGDIFRNFKHVRISHH